MHITSGQRNNLRQWLLEWGIYNELDQSAQEELSVEAAQFSVAGQHTPACGLVVRLGDVRLLYPNTKASWRRPVYVAVLRELDDNSVVVAPFSRFANPALPGEWSTGRNEQQLRVLCLWNMFQFRRSRFENSWEVDRLLPDELDGALSVLAAMRKGGDVPKSMADRVGPGLISPTDPRWDYQQQELEMVDSLEPMRDFGSSGRPYATKEEPVEYRGRAAERDDSGYDE